MVQTTIEPRQVDLAANPTGNVGLTAVNGIATRFIRSDGAPQLSQAIVPTWTGKHTFDRTLGVTDLETGLKIEIDNAGAAAGTISQYGLHVVFDNAADDNGELVHVIGIRGEATLSTAYDGGTFRAVYGKVSKSGAGTLDNARGLESVVDCTAGTIGVARALQLSVINSATVTVAYGLYIGTIAGSTEYGIYQSDVSNDNYFAGTISQAPSKYVATSEVRAASAAGLKLYEDGGKGMFVEDTTGHVGFLHNVPTSPIHLLWSSTTVWSARFENTGDSHTAYGINIQAGLDAGEVAVSGYYIWFKDGGGFNTGEITCNAAQQAVYGSVSDRRVKDDIVNTTLGVADLKKVKVREFGTINNPTHRQVGFVAQELIEACPGAVIVPPEDGPTDLWAIDYGRVTPLLVAATQELVGRVETLANRLDALEA